ncbi:ABC transporter ATP-binding protein [Clostridiales bacterium NSJ-40]|uniref:ABC transporter ATP-binding protein n=2 Tax=Yeguia hominis TaxID=2763662 RepID=A0A926D8W1_9FIRM|nr:ABC transporter ATP-binding protein [Yeguia hominis]
MALIEMKDLVKQYMVGNEVIRALDEVSLQIAEGEFLAIIGPSGSGKSTLMNLLGCLDVPDEGEYWLEGHCVADLTERQLSEIRNREIGFIFQGFNLVQELSAEENVELPLLYRGTPRRERRRLAQEALAAVGLESRMEHYPNQMSGGQQQRVAIARAVAAQPKILLADEPTGNLDSKTGEDVMQMLETFHRGGHTIVMITHDPKVAARASRMVRICDGKLEAVSL